ncbi:hypothetical protein UFOVP1323_1, partial [uncultured Caudovirales phage]
MVTQNIAAPATAPRVLSNSAGDMSSLMPTMREAVKAIGVSGAAAANAAGVLTASVTIGYQNNPSFKDSVDKYLKAKAKEASKEARAAAMWWMMKEFEITKPGKGALGKATFMFNNRKAKIETAFTRAVSYTERGLFFVRDGKRVYLPADMYRKAIDNDHKGTAPIEVTTMNEKDSVTWTGLAPKKVAQAPTTAPNGTVISASAGNFSILCKATKNAAEAVEPQKMTGADTLAALNA